MPFLIQVGVDHGRRLADGFAQVMDGLIQLTRTLSSFPSTGSAQVGRSRSAEPGKRFARRIAESPLSNSPGQQLEDREISGYEVPSF